MTTPSPDFSLVVTAVPDALIVEVAGDLDRGTGEKLIRTVAERLTPDTAFRRLRLDFRHLTWIDSMGLSALLMVHHHADTAGVGLRLDRRPDFLERLLDLTGTFTYLTGIPRAAGEVPDAGAG
ncbi:hypothetical protein GCM10010129_24300 [Streptomyces fumigatiscleroticus]|nr:hypothetical protein GCM10010129_24300 [Streptomyces fumigatiscleroticus]